MSCLLFTRLKWQLSVLRSTSQHAIASFMVPSVK